MEDGKESFPAVYKPQKGETPLWDFPAGTLCQREVAAFVISEALGWELVPPTVFPEKSPPGKRRPATISWSMIPNSITFHLKKKSASGLKPAVLFDLIINNADRKGGHILLDEERPSVAD